LAAGLANAPAAARAAAAVLRYVRDTQPAALAHLRRLATYRVSDSMQLDEATRANLELTRTLAGARKKGSLLALMDRTETAMGARSALLWNLGGGLDPCADVRDELVRALADDPPPGLREGGLIRRGFNAELDELIDIGTKGKETIARIEVRERERTGIASLKVR